MWIWLGENEFIPGVPPRDMTDAEVEKRGVKELVKLSPLYEYIEPANAEEEEE